MTDNARGAARGSIGFGIGALVATLFGFLGFPFVGLIIGGAVAGTLLARRVRNIGLIALAAIGADLGLLLGGPVVVMSLGVLAFGMEDVPGPATFGVLLGFYSVFILGFAVAGATIAAATVSRLVSLWSSAKAFAAGGAIGGGIIIAAELMKVSTSAVYFTAVTISVIVAGALCGASLSSSSKSLILDH